MPLRFIMPSSIQTTQAARFKNHKRKQPKPKRGTKSNSPAPISCGFLDTASPSGINESPKNTKTAKVHDTNEDLEDMIFLLCFTVLSFRYVIPYCCKLNFRVLLKSNICPKVKLGHFFILNTDLGRGRRLRRPEKPQMRVTGCRGRQPLRVLRLFPRQTNHTFDVGQESKRSHFSTSPDQKVRRKARFFLFFLKQM